MASIDVTSVETHHFQSIGDLCEYFCDRNPDCSGCPFDSDDALCLISSYLDACKRKDKETMQKHEPEILSKVKYEYIKGDIDHTHSNIYGYSKRKTTFEIIPDVEE